MSQILYIPTSTIMQLDLFQSTTSHIVEKHIFRKDADDWIDYLCSNITTVYKKEILRLNGISYSDLKPEEFEILQ